MANDIGATGIASLLPPGSPPRRRRLPADAVDDAGDGRTRDAGQRRGFRTLHPKTSHPAGAPKPSAPGPGRPRGSKNHHRAPLPRRRQNHHIDQTIAEGKTATVNDKLRGPLVNVPCRATLDCQVKAGQGRSKLSSPLTRADGRKTSLLSYLQILGIEIRWRPAYG